MICKQFAHAGTSINKKTYDEKGRTSHVKVGQRARRTFINGQQQGKTVRPCACKAKVPGVCPKVGTKREGSILVPTSICLCIQKLERDSLEKKA